MRPVIGIPCYAAERAGNNRPIFGNNRAYAQAVLRAGGAPILLPPVEDEDVLAAIRPRLDGLLLSGGGDVDPARYHEEALPETDEPETARDFTEFRLTEWALEDGLPILGICRGMQVLNVALDGTLYQDIPLQLPQAARHNYAPRAGDTIAHRLRVAAGSRFATIAGTEQPAANSFHHQAVKEPGRGIEIVGWSDDGLPEALEAPAYPFVVAVQYHPEALDPSDVPSQRLFRALVEACEARVASAGQPRKVAQARRTSRPKLRVVNA
jgi:putative glutamine amidotransferase